MSRPLAWHLQNSAQDPAVTDKGSALVLGNPSGELDPPLRVLFLGCQSRGFAWVCLHKPNVAEEADPFASRWLSQIHCQPAGALAPHCAKCRWVMVALVACPCLHQYCAGNLVGIRCRLALRAVFPYCVRYSMLYHNVRTSRVSVRVW